jgi:hypothetical protein
MTEWKATTTGDKETRRGETFISLLTFYFNLCIDFLGSNYVTMTRRQMTEWKTTTGTTRHAERRPAATTTGELFVLLFDLCFELMQ